MPGGSLSDEDRAKTGVGAIHEVPRRKSHGECIMPMNAGTGNHKEQPGTEEPASCHHTTVLEHVEPLGFQTSGAGWIPSPFASSNHMKKKLAGVSSHSISRELVNQS